MPCARSCRARRAKDVAEYNRSRRHFACYARYARRLYAMLIERAMRTRCSYLGAAAAPFRRAGAIRRCQRCHERNTQVFAAACAAGVRIRLLMMLLPTCATPCRLLTFVA